MSEDCGNKPNQTTVQCITIQFLKTVYEGFDEIIDVEPNKLNLSLTIYSNTPNTKSLKGYDVVTDVPCQERSQTSGDQETCKARVVSHY